MIKLILIKYILFLFICLSCIHGCKSKTEEKALIINNMEIGDLADTIRQSDESDKTGFHSDDYNFIIETIDSTYFHSFSPIQDKEQSAPIKITSLSTVKKILKDYLYINNSANNSISILEIKDKNGNKLLSEREAKYTFIAYYPAEDVLLFNDEKGCEIIFNLTTGEDAHSIGSPESSVISPLKKFEIRNYLSTGGCSKYLIRETKNGQFHKISDIYQDNLCNIIYSFWTDDNTYYYSANLSNDKSDKYYKLIISEKPQ